MTTTPTVPSRVDITQYSGKDTLMRLLRQEYAAAIDMLSDATDEQWHAQTPCEAWQVRDMAGHLLDAAYCYLGYFRQGEHGWPTEEPRGMRAYAEALAGSARDYRDTYRWEVLGRLDACVEQLFEYFDRLTEDEWMGRLVPHKWAGPVPAFMMATFQLMDYSVHNWDLRKALGSEAFVDAEASDTLVPFMFALWQLCFTPEMAEGTKLTIGVHLSDPREEDWTVQIADGSFTFQPGVPDNADATFSFTCHDFSLDAYQRIQGGAASGDQAAVDQFRKLFFTV